MKYVHTNIIARDAGRLIQFYKDVFGCRSIGETRDLNGKWLDRLTGITGAHIKGEHLSLPGYGGRDGVPTLEIFSYDECSENPARSINASGFAHIAFLVDDVAGTMKKVIDHGGTTVGELVETEYEDGRQACFVYVRDIEGNIIELQSWNRP